MAQKDYPSVREPNFSELKSQQTHDQPTNQFNTELNTMITQLEQDRRGKYANYVTSRYQEGKFTGFFGDIQVQKRNSGGMEPAKSKSGVKNRFFREKFCANAQTPFLNSEKYIF